MWWLYALGGTVTLLLFFTIKNVIWDKPHKKIENLHKDIEMLQKLHKQEILKLEARLNNNTSLRIQEREFTDIVVSSAWKELAELCNKQYAFLGIPQSYSRYVRDKDGIIEPIKRRFSAAIEEQYKYQYLTFLYPELSRIFNGVEIMQTISELPSTIAARSENLFEIVNLLRSNSKTAEELIYWKNRVSFLEASKSNLTAIPYMAGIMADYETFGLERLAKELDWGYAITRMNKVKSIREIKNDAKAVVEKNKESQYQLAYLLNLFPNLEDIVETEFSQLPVIEVSELSDYDSARDYLSREEYLALSECERNQLALDRYRKSHKRTKWQVGRDYELYIGHRYAQKGYMVDYFGSYMGLGDLGRDLIVKGDNRTLIIQCKYWSANKMIREKHILQLYGSVVSYCLENDVSQDNVKGVLVTNITLSDTAKKMARYLGVNYEECVESGDYPCIKCNIGRDEFGSETKIYHLPFDQQYDTTKISKTGEFFAMTVEEAENAGFRRAFRWYNN